MRNNRITDGQIPSSSHHACLPKIFLTCVTKASNGAQLCASWKLAYRQPPGVHDQRHAHVQHSVQAVHGHMMHPFRCAYLGEESNVSLDTTFYICLQTLYLHLRTSLPIWYWIYMVVQKGFGHGAVYPWGTGIGFDCWTRYLASSCIFSILLHHCQRSCRLVFDVAQSNWQILRKGFDRSGLSLDGHGKGFSESIPATLMYFEFLH